MDALVYSTEHFRYLIEQNKYLTTALLDLSKALDSINHNILMLKLEESGFSTSAQMLILDYLSNRLQETKANSIESDWNQFYQGVTARSNTRATTIQSLHKRPKIESIKRLSTSTIC